MKDTPFAGPETSFVSRLEPADAVLLRAKPLTFASRWTDSVKSEMSVHKFASAHISGRKAMEKCLVTSQTESSRQARSGQGSVIAT